MSPHSKAAAVLTVLLAAAPAGADVMATDSAVPQEITSGWDSSRRSADKTWVEYPFKDEWGRQRSVWARRSDSSPTCTPSKENCEAIFLKKYPLFYLEAAAAPPESASDASVSFKKAVLSAYEMAPEKTTGGYNIFMTSPGTSLKLRPDSRYCMKPTPDGPETCVPAAPAGDWVVLAPSRHEMRQPSPMDDLGTWPSCDLAPNAVYKKLHPVEVELATIDAAYGARFMFSADFKQAAADAGISKPETVYIYAAKLRAAVYPKAKAAAGADPSAAPQSKFTAFEAQFLACHLDSVSGGSYEDRFYQLMRSAADPAQFVSAWRGFVHDELQAYVAYAKDLPGAKDTTSPWEGYGSHDFDKLASDLRGRVYAAVDAASKPPPQPKPSALTAANKSQVDQTVTDILGRP